ncbi:hypothetical protein GCM10027515_06610 [Schumannella luteola]|uniref:DUF6916 domain-containing protein n=1 Tax=Schumannella luteola TaxID=472059 RepID=A0A852YES9_9MICO|nr:hypothetical protein [Schumannella luteola]NYG98207.1 hypothetical protein [Schumannella luteola]TPX03241.1 hypothetical protein FJ656_18245 [Schumannella luteola]
MQLTRRTAVVSAGAVALAAVGAAAAASAAQAAPAAASSTAKTAATAVGTHAAALVELRAAVRSDFAPLVGQAITASAPDGVTGSLVLDAIADVAGATAGDENRFTLLFHAPDDFAEGIWQLGHYGVPTSDFLLTPIGPAGDRRAQALVNRI